jgi:predicted transcriptional regulator
MLTPLELDIMKAVWNKAPTSVKDVQAAIRPQRKLAYTTVMTIMHRMHQKGYLTRRLKSRAHMYEPAITYVDVRDAELERFVDNFFSGSRSRLIDFLDDETERAAIESVHLPARHLDEELL